MKNKNNIFIFMLVTLAALFLSFGCADISVNTPADVDVPGVTNNQKYKLSVSFSYDVDLTDQTTLRLENINGIVTLQSVTGTNQVKISGEKIVHSDTYMDANSHLKDITVEINELTNEILVKTLQPQFSDGRSYQVNYTITVPSHLNLVVDNGNGKISGRVFIPTNGSVEINLLNGGIEVDIPQNTSTDFFASHVNGSISLHNLTLYNRVETSKSLQGRLGDGQGTINLRTNNGNIDVSGF